MSIANTLKLLSAFLMLDYSVNAQRISELYCNDYSLLHTHPKSSHPHLVKVVENVERLNSPVIYGILISEDFVLTSDLTWRLPRFNITNFTNLKVRKAFVTGDQYQDEQLFSIARYIPLNTSGIDNTLIDIGLLQLREAIPYHKSSSVFRPACPWTDALLPKSVKYSYVKDSQHFIKPISYQIFADGECPNISRGYFRRPYICLNITGAVRNPLRTLDEWNGALEANVNNRNYVVGLILYFREGNAVVLAFSDIISWIESVVWPDGYKPISGCGQRQVIHRPFITLGLPTYHGEYPWHVALYRSEGGRNNSLNYICGGTIISTRTVVTAAHCVQSELGLLPASRLIIVAGIHNLNEYTLDTQSYFVQNITVHENYNRDYLENDIALIKLRCPITFSPYIQPICLRNSSDFNTTIGTVVGWGLNELQQPSDILLQADFPIHTNNDCRASNRVFFSMYLNDNNFCAGYRNGTSVCSGDSGGGMIFEHNSQFYIRGIVSVGPALPQSSSCDITQFVVFTDVTKFFNWIKVHTDNDD